MFCTFDIALYFANMASVVMMIVTMIVTMMMMMMKMIVMVMILVISNNHLYFAVFQFLLYTNLFCIFDSG